MFKSTIISITNTIPSVIVIDPTIWSGYNYDIATAIISIRISSLLIDGNIIV